MSWFSRDRKIEAANQVNICLGKCRAERPKPWLFCFAGRRNTHFLYHPYCISLSEDNFDSRSPPAIYCIAMNVCFSRTHAPMNCTNQENQSAFTIFNGRIDQTLMKVTVAIHPILTHLPSIDTCLVSPDNIYVLVFRSEHSNNSGPPVKGK